MLSVLILGASGFIGSNVSELFVKSGYNVIAIDGCLDKTGGDKTHLDSIASEIKYIEKRIEKVNELPEIVQSVDIIVDCMAWTSHHLALTNPIYDLELNVKSHLQFIAQIPDYYKGKIIYLASRGQYGNPHTNIIDENTPMIPEDIQGIHKLTAESYYRVYSKLKYFDIVSLRFPNCFGKNQPTSGGDIGLIGGFIMKALDGQEIKVFGDGRKRNIVFVEDLINDILKLSKKDFKGFNAFNVRGMDVSIHTLASEIVSIVGGGSVIREELTDIIKAIDTGNTEYSEVKLSKYLGQRTLTDLTTSLNLTIKYFREKLNALEM
jgi:nucleoside-diphosphate-sugar epimerase